MGTTSTAAASAAPPRLCSVWGGDFSIQDHDPAQSLCLLLNSSLRESSAGVRGFALLGNDVRARAAESHSNYLKRDRASEC